MFNGPVLYRNVSNVSWNTFRVDDAGGDTEGVDGHDVGKDAGVEAGEDDAEEDAGVEAGEEDAEDTGRYPGEAVKTTPTEEETSNIQRRHTQP